MKGKAIIRAATVAMVLLGLGACTQPRTPVALIEPSYSHLRDGNQPGSPMISPLAQRAADPVMVRR